VRTVRIEALTMADMAREEILPAVLRYTGDLSSWINEKKKAVAVLPCRAETKLLEKLSGLADEIDAAIEALEESIDSRIGEDITAQAFFIRDELLGKMDMLRTLCDKAETLTAASYWPFPTYGDLLFKV
jgi:glutamine synthetase